MEEKAKTTNVDVEELQSKLEEFAKEVADQKRLAEFYRKRAEQYESWWLSGIAKVKSMKEDMQDVQRFTKKITERW